MVAVLGYRQPLRIKTRYKTLYVWETKLSYCDTQGALCSFVGVPVHSRGNWRNLQKLKEVNHVHKCKPSKTLETCDKTNIYNFIQLK